MNENVNSNSLEKLQFRFDDEEELRMNEIRFSIHHQIQLLQFQYHPSSMKKNHSLQLPKKFLITNL